MTQPTVNRMNHLLLREKFSKLMTELLSLELNNGNNDEIYLESANHMRNNDHNKKQNNENIYEIDVSRDDIYEKGMSRTGGISCVFTLSSFIFSLKDYVNHEYPT